MNVKTLTFGLTLGAALAAQNLFADFAADCSGHAARCTLGRGFEYPFAVSPSRAGGSAEQPADCASQTAQHAAARAFVRCDG